MNRLFLLITFPSGIAGLTAGEIEVETGNRRDITGEI